MYREKMTMKRPILWLSLICLLGVLWGQGGAGVFDDRFPSARSTGMGGTGVALSNDVWAAYYNPASLSLLEKPMFGSSYLRLFNASFLRNFFVAGAYPLPRRYGTVSLSVQYFGVNYQGRDLSSEYTFSLSHGFYLIKDIHTSLAFGYSLKLYYWNLGQSLQFGDLGSSSTFGLDLGFQASVYNRTYVGVYVLNVNAPQIGEVAKNDLPQRVVVGVAYHPYDGVTTSLNFNRLIGSEKNQVWAGAEFNVFRYLFLRFGGTSNPNRFSTGLGIRYGKIQLDYALLTHSELGETHQLGFMVLLP